MKLFILLTVFSFSAQIYAEVDYSHCMHSVNQLTMPNVPCNQEQMAANPGLCNPRRMKDQNSSFYPFELTSDGKIKPHPKVSYKNVDGKETVEVNQPGMRNIISFKRNEKGELLAIENDIKSSFFRGKESLVDEVNTNFEVKNGKCFPARLEKISSVGNETRQDVLYEVHLCRQLKKFFAGNPDAAACLNKGYISQINEILRDYYKRNEDVYGEANVANFNLKTPTPSKTKLNIPQIPDLDMFSNARFLQPAVPSIDSSVMVSSGVFGSSTVNSAAIINENCNSPEVAGVLHEVLDDEEIWKEALVPVVSTPSDAVSK